MARPVNQASRSSRLQLKADDTPEERGEASGVRSLTFDIQLSTTQAHVIVTKTLTARIT